MSTHSALVTGPHVLRPAARAGGVVARGWYEALRAAGGTTAEAGATTGRPVLADLGVQVLIRRDRKVRDEILALSATLVEGGATKATVGMDQDNRDVRR